DVEGVGPDPAEQHVELRETEGEAVFLVDQRDSNLAGERVGQAACELEPAEPGSEDHDVLHGSQPYAESRYASTASTRRCVSSDGGSASFLKIDATCFSTAPTVSTSVSAMPALERPSAISASTSFSRGVSSARRSSRRPTKCATTSGSRAVPPSATRRTVSTNASTSITRSFSTYPTPPRPSARSSRAYVPRRTARRSERRCRGLARADGARPGALRRGTSGACECRQSRCQAARAVPRARGRLRR